MKSINSIKQKFALILAIAVSAICLTWLATSVTNNVFAEETQNYEEDALPEFAYSVSPLECRNFCGFDLPRVGGGDYFEFTVRDTTTDYYIDVMTETGPTIYAEITVYKSTALRNGWLFQGAYINNVSVESGQRIYSDVNLELRFSSLPASLTIAVEDISGTLDVEGYNVKLYDKNYNLYSSKTTDSYGEAIFEDISVEDLKGGYAWLEKEGASDAVAYITNAVFLRRPYEIDVAVCEESDVDFCISSSNPGHGYFAEHVDVEETRPTPTTYSGDSFYTKGNFYYSNKLNGVYSVTDEGSLKAHFEERYKSTDATYTAVSSDQRDVLYWHIDYGQNESVDLHPGDDPLDFTEAEVLYMNIEPVYGDAPEPTPTPTPTEEVNAAQTGDNNILAIVAFAIVALAGGTTLIIRNRKEKHEVN